MSLGRILGLLSLAIFIAELAVMGLLAYFPVGNLLFEAVIDASALLAVIFPVLYFFVLKAMLSAQTSLEEDVGKRTAEIVNAKTELEQTVEKLRDQEKKMVLLGEMGGFFQSCENLDEAMSVAEVQLSKLFPDMTGALFLINSSRNIVERRAMWGKSSHPAQFSPPDCWALRRSKPHLAKRAEQMLVCSHTEADEASWQICLPLVAQGEAIGVLCMASIDSRETTSETKIGQERMELLIAASENVSLAVANLRLREKLSYQALRDPLTGLFNRRYLFDTLDRELDRAFASGQTVSVAMFDIDHFKRLNDSFGHAAGDAVLAKLGIVLRDWAQGGEIVVRFGGEEFTVVLPDAKHDDAFARIETLRKTIEALAMEYEGESLGQVTISAGIGTCPPDKSDRETLLARADEALYESKKSGRNRTTVACPLPGAAPVRAA